MELSIKKAAYIALGAQKNMALSFSKILFALLFFSTSPLFADNWETFGKDSEHSGYIEVNFKSPELKNIWKFTPTLHAWAYEKTSYEKGMNVWSSSYSTLDIGDKKIIYSGFYDHNLYAIDSETGEYIWRYTTGGTLNSSPAAKEINGTPFVFIASSDRTVYAINGHTGKKIWSYETEVWDYTTSKSIPSSPIVEKIGEQYFLFICIWNNNFASFRNIQKGELFSFNALSGELIWRKRLTSLPLNSPAITYIGDKPVIFVTSHDGNLYSIDARDGNILWHFISDSSIRSSPVIIKINNKKYVIFGTRFGNIYAIEAESSAIFWKIKTGHAVDSTGAFAIVENKPLIFIGSHDRNVYAINCFDGKKVWSFQTQNFIATSPAMANIAGKIVVFINSMDDNIYCLDAFSGKELWQYKTGKLIWEYTTRGDTPWSSPIVTENKKGPILIFGSYDGTMYAFN
nr:PQQ-binding-like beta-propeller repeat protein [Candidatus Omnitrophota bacterium]